MKRTDVVSTRIKSIGWEHGILEVEFRRTEAVYQYENVPYEVYCGILTAKSSGQYFGTNIVNNPDYTAHRIDVEQKRSA